MKSDSCHLFEIDMAKINIEQVSRVHLCFSLLRLPLRRFVSLLSSNCLGCGLADRSKFRFELIIKMCTSTFHKKKTEKLLCLPAASSVFSLLFDFSKTRSNDHFRFLSITCCVYLFIHRHTIDLSVTRGTWPRTMNCHCSYSKAR